MKRFLTLTLAALMLLSTLAACSSGDTSTTDTTAAPAETTVAPAETADPNYDANGYLKDDLDPSLKFGGEKFTLLYWEDVERLEFEAADLNGDLINDALYHRNLTVEERLEIDFEWISTPGNYYNMTGFISKISNDINAGGSYDAFAGYSMTGATMAVQGLSRDLTRLDHINFEQPWWPEYLLDSATIDNRLYFATGDISTNVLHMMYCTLFNKDMAKEFNLEDLYAMVDNGTWTIDKMGELASVAYGDLNGNTTADTDDRFGLAIGRDIHFDAFFTGANIQAVAKDENDSLIPDPSFSAERTQSLLEKVVGIFHNNDYAAFPTKISGWNNIPFAEGRVLFTVDRNYITSSADFANSTVSYGVLPVPKYDEVQENYYACLGAPFTIYAVSTAIDDERANRAGAVLECMASESYRQVTPAVFEIAMKVRYASEDNDSRMYDIIRNGVLIELGRIFEKQVSGIDVYPRNNSVSGNTNWMSMMKVTEKQLTNALKKITDSIRSRTDY